MGPTWGPTRSCRPQVGPRWAHSPCYLGSYSITQRESTACTMNYTHSLLPISFRVNSLVQGQKNTWLTQAKWSNSERYDTSVRKSQDTTVFKEFMILQEFNPQILMASYRSLQWIYGSDTLIITLWNYIAFWTELLGCKNKLVRFLDFLGLKKKHFSNWGLSRIWGLWGTLIIPGMCCSYRCGQTV